jgi:hypothetical protein
VGADSIPFSRAGIDRRRKALTRNQQRTNTISSHHASCHQSSAAPSPATARQDTGTLTNQDY